MNSTVFANSKISPWGNSLALRLPKNVLNAASLSSGDEVTVGVNESGYIEIVPKQQAHRRVKPMKGISFDSLFANWRPDTELSESQNAPWPNEDMMGAEMNAWR